MGKVDKVLESENAACMECIAKFQRENFGMQFDYSGCAGCTRGKNVHEQDQAQWDDFSERNGKYEQYRERGTY